MKTLMAYAEDFLNARDVGRAYAELIRTRCRSYARFRRRSVHVDEIDAPTVNAWLTRLQSTGLRPATVAGYRRNILVVWRAAVEDGLNSNPVLRVKAIRVPQQVVEAYTHHEIRALLHAASKLRGRHRNGNKRSHFWEAMIHAAYSTALRRSDLLLIFRRQVQSDGTATIIQSKTGFSHRVKFSAEALTATAKLHDPNGLLLPWPYRRDALPPRFQAIKRLAGIERGTLRWLRRSAASYAERETPGAGPRLLGHQGERVYRQFYEDRSIANEVPVSPPLL